MTEQPTHICSVKQHKIRDRRKLKRMPRMIEEHTLDKEKVEVNHIIMPNNRFKQSWDLGLFVILM